MSGERGSALIIAVLVMAVLTLLGVSYLLIADTENKIAENEKLSAQALYFAEGTAREVKRWFDRPPYGPNGGANLTRPTTAVMNRAKRHIDVDGPGPGAEVAADGSPARPFYKTGVDRDGDGNDDVFDKPYRPGLADMFVGTASNPDIEIDRAWSSGAAAFLDGMSEKIMPGFPAAGAGVSARVKSIAAYAPPYLDSGGGTWIRYGVATVSARVQILRNPGAADELVLADRTVTVVLNEAPYAAAFGPLHSCDELGWNGAFRVHWGPATAAAGGDMQPGTAAGMARSVPRDLPATPRIDLLHGHLSPSGDGAWNDLSTNLEGKTIDDPWFRFFAGLDVVNWSALGSPQVYPPGVADQDESNKFQNYPNVPCPDFDYRTWKSIARSGGSDVHYFSWDGSGFNENGIPGGATGFEGLTDGKTGLFFFDTADALAPHDYDAGNVAANLTPDINIAGGGYGVRGLVYVNARLWSVSGAPGRPATFTFPGEPFRDRNENGVHDGPPDGGEEWINLRYRAITSLTDPIVVDSSDTYDPSVPPPTPPHAIWNSQGPSVTHDAVVWGILYVAGQFDASGTAYYDGSVVTYAGTETGTKTSGTANLYWDPHIKDDWPPPGWDLPRVVVTRWQTDG